MKFEIKKKLLSNVSKTELKKENVKGITIFCLPEWYNKKAQYTGYDEINKLNKDKVDFGFHYGIDQYDVINYIDPKHQAKAIMDNHTYISTALYKQKPEEATISVCLFISKEHDYELTEKYFVRFLVKLIRDYKLTQKDIWRGFDLSKTDKGPFHILDKKIFNKYLFEIEKYLKVTDDKLTAEEQAKKDDEVKFVSPYQSLIDPTDDKATIDKYIKDFYDENLKSADDYVKKFQPWHKEIKEIIEASKDANVGDLKIKEYLTGNKLQYKITQNAPISSCDCVKASDKLEGINTTKETMVEPIYPDLITPPGGDIHIANGSSSAVTPSSSNTPLTVEEFEKRQKTFSMDNFKDVKKQTIGRPINCDDPFPVDNQIKKLEEHFPKVKVDNIKFDYEEDNHLGSALGAALSKNYNMCYDMISEVSKRTEQRLVKIENNLSTTMRNLFRMSSRVNINCVYYGGQSVYGKYNCIRCLQDDRINDGAVVSLDQCLCCTRYEPIIGQVYAILDEAGSNVTQVIDDMQMAYMGLDQYKKLNTVKEMHEDLNFANLKVDASETPLPFLEDKWKDTEAEMKEKGYSEKDGGIVEDKNENSADDTKPEADDNESVTVVKKYVNGFKMDWNPSLLETHSPAINQYVIEDKEIDKVIPSLENQVIDRDLFIDSRENAVEYEKLEFDISNYALADYSASSSSGGSDGSFGMGASEARNKIVEYAVAAVELCKQGKAQYSQERRYNHGDKAINGISYWDCSSLVQRAYEAAGITGIGTYTGNQYPFCLDKSGGIVIPIKNVSEALPGDVIWFIPPPFPSDKAGLQNVNIPDIHHVAIYIGDNKYAHASKHNPSDPTKDLKISTLGYYSHEMCFGRVKKLIDLDKQASQGLSGVEAWDKTKHGISDELWNASKVADSNVKGFISNMNKYGYKNALIKQANAHKFDPYFIAALCAIESSGDPTCGGNYPGIIQSSRGYATTSLSGIEDNLKIGCEDLINKGSWLKKKGWPETNIHLLATAHNCGQYGTTDALGHSNESKPHIAIPLLGEKVDLATCKIPKVGQMMYDYSKKYQRGWNPEEKRTYACKVLRAYNLLHSQKVLG